MEIPVYLFTGFLESGKTTFIQEILESGDFGTEERTLLLVCEEGEEEYRPEDFFPGTADKIVIETIESEEDINPEYLKKLEQAHKVDRVILEYNGMWLLEKLFTNMPENWVIYQEMTFMDATTFLNYNQNMRQQVFDKLKTADLVVFNRCDRGNFDQDTKMEFHKIVRVANRRNQIVYEYGPNDTEPDTIVDPLPYDIDSDYIEIKEEYFAEWYRDVNEEPEKYQGKTIKVKGRVALGPGIPEGSFVFGRHVMTCCAADIQFAGLLAVYDRVKSIKHGGWVDIEAQVRVEETPVYGEAGPVLYCKSVKASLPADPEVATF
ncbi:MAG: hypothetical protein J6H21_01450 [Firmicutes bacterium]|nr:hypothetical protein [Bacillota bacterium]